MDKSDIVRMDAQDGTGLVIEQVVSKMAKSPLFQIGVLQMVAKGLKVARDDEEPGVIEFEVEAPNPFGTVLFSIAVIPVKDRGRQQELMLNVRRQDVARREQALGKNVIPFPKRPTA